MKEIKDRRILVVHEKVQVSSYVAEKLRSWGCRVDVTANGYTAMEKIVFFSYYAVFISTTLPLTNYRDLIKRMLKDYPDIYVVVLGPEADMNEIESIRRDTDFHIPDPMDDHLISSTLYRMSELRPDLKKYFEDIPLVTFDFERMIGKHPRMEELYKIITKLSGSSVTVLILGESGTGKELTARAIHYSGDRKNCPFIAVSCAAIPENLLESELFGHEKGSFTGAVAQKIGKFSQAHKGTIFLDEIAEMSPSLQAKLLRVLEESEFQRVGGTEKIKVDVRIISATNKDLWEMTKKGQFRQDLYYRLSAFPIHLPPLRERRSDIPPIAKHFIKKHHKRAGKNLCKIDKKAMDILMNFSWKGNIRELENVIERSLVMCENNLICKEDLPEYLIQHISKNIAPISEPVAEESLISLKPLEEIEKEAIIKALQKSSGNQSEAARQLKMNLITFYRKIKKYNIIISKIKS